MTATPTFQFVPQKTGSDYQRGSMSTRSQTERVMIHCTADPEGSDKGYDDLWRVHVENNGWSDIGYHWVIMLDGTILECRKEHLQGAGCSGQNHDTIHISYVGGMDEDYVYAKDTMTDAQEASMRRILLDIQQRYPNISREEVVGHNDFSSKACPSYSVDDKLIELDALGGEIGTPEPGMPDQPPGMAISELYAIVATQQEQIAALQAEITGLKEWAGSYK